MHLVSNFYDLPLKSWFFGQLEPIKRQLRIFEFGSLVYFKGGGVQGKFFWRIRFELWAPQVPLIIGETFGEVLGPRRPTVSEPRPAQKLGVK